MHKGSPQAGRENKKRHQKKSSKEGRVGDGVRGR